MRAKLWPVAVALITVLAGCDPLDGGSGGSDSGAVDSGGCQQAGPLTRDFLPAFPAGSVNTRENPCLGLAGMISEVSGLISGVRKEIPDYAAKFDAVASRVSAVGDAVECGYKTDRLAIGVYQHKGVAWSVGVTIVVRGRVAAVADVGACWLLSQIWLGPQGGQPGDRPEPAFCGDGVTRHTPDGEVYTVVWIGLSTTMCGTLSAQLTPGTKYSNGSITAVVKATPDVALRPGPDTKGGELGRLATGAILIASCVRGGEPVSGRRGSSDQWLHVKPDDGTGGPAVGYVSAAWLDWGDDRDLKPC